VLRRECACGGTAATSRPAPGGLRKPPLGHDFARVRVLASGAAAEPGQSSDGPADDPIHQPLIDEFRARQGLPPGGVDEFGSPVGPSDADIKYHGLALTCPTTTQVDGTTDLTAAGLAAGFRSAYGIVVRMRVTPDVRSWDGVRVSESFAPVSSTCPAGLTVPGPCSGDATFTVGAPSGGSNVLAVQPGVRNCFYDFHTSRSRTVSFLHDATRNPAGLDSCEVVCRQDYSCDGVVIGQHTVTRTFRKGVQGRTPVTIVDVTKT
jgi:hypothetical protein